MGSPFQRYRHPAWSTQYHFHEISVTLRACPTGAAMNKEESEKLQKALLELTRENDSKEKAIHLFMQDGYFDENGKLAPEFRESE